MSGQPSVFDTAAHSGTEAGCGDCVWTITLACDFSAPRKPLQDTACTEARTAAGCRRGLLERLFLTDHVVSLEPEGTFCLRPANHVIPVGDIALADVGRYLKDVTPPDLDISTKPRGETLAGLPTYFTAAPPKGLRPTPFGGGQVHETITIAAQQADWSWGDGITTGWVPATRQTTHRYEHGGRAHGRVTTRWGASYTITFDGQTFGPYDANGRLTKQQQFVLPVDTSSPTLVSHG